MQNHILFTSSFVHPEGLTGPAILESSCGFWLLPASPSGSCLTLVPKSQDTQRATKMNKIRDSIHEGLMFHFLEGLY